jgi:hypothetical protein
MVDVIIIHALILTLMLLSSSCHYGTSLPLKRPIHHDTTTKAMLMPRWYGHESTPVISISSGDIRGWRYDGVDHFANIPFAAPPVGEKRFQSPVTPSSYVLSYTSPHCSRYIIATCTHCDPKYSYHICYMPNSWNGTRQWNGPSLLPMCPQIKVGSIHLGKFTIKRECNHVPHKSCQILDQIS